MSEISSFFLKYIIAVSPRAIIQSCEQDEELKVLAMGAYKLVRDRDRFLNSEVLRRKFGLF